MRSVALIFSASSINRTSSDVSHSMAEFSHKLLWRFGMDIIEGIDGFTEDGGEGRTTFGFAFPNADGPGTPACVASLFVPPDPPMLDFKC